MKFDLYGKKFGRLKVIDFDECKYIGGRKKAFWKCKCDCGSIVSVERHHLLCGDTRSCGCLRDEISTKIIQNYNKAYNNPDQKKQYGPERVRIYGIWRKMIERCYDPKCLKYKSYGDRGIKVCDDWRTNFEAFYGWALENGYKFGLSIDRINNDNNYEPSNCRWATKKQQANNTRNNVKVLYQNREYTLAELSEISGIKYGTIWYRHKHGWCDDKLTIPLRRTKNENCIGA